MNKKIKIGGEDIDTSFNFRTTKFILSSFMEEAVNKNTSVNLLFNQTLLPKAKKLKEKNKNTLK
jgi:hypothetical protein